MTQIVAKVTIINLRYVIVAWRAPAGNCTSLSGQLNLLL